ncbi:hypothetical protein [Sphingobacterium kitahiroshimense]|uniref:MarR family transcriptional regulator n=1 Tax=Sphingobacterium kitahiroshimense TaxID=470446 RepID=A0ABV0BR73_9SPHI
MKYVDNENITRKHDLTIKEVQSFPMFAHFTDEQTKEIINTLKIFAEIALESHKKEQEKQGNTADF